MIFSKQIRYRFGDIDDAGIAYYPSFFHYFHCAFEDWWSDGIGTPYDQILHVEKLGFPAVHIESDFLSPIRYGDTPFIHLGILRMGKSSAEFGYWMTQDAATAPLCRARITTVSVDMVTLEKRPIPDKWRREFERFVISESEYFAVSPEASCDE